MLSKVKDLLSLIGDYFKFHDKATEEKIKDILSYGLGTFKVRGNYVRVGFLYDDDNKRIEVYLSPDKEVLLKFGRLLTSPEELDLFRKLFNYKRIKELRIKDHIIKFEGNLEEIVKETVFNPADYVAPRHEEWIIGGGWK